MSSLFARAGHDKHQQTYELWVALVLGSSKAVVVSTTSLHRPRRRSDTFDEIHARLPFTGCLDGEELCRLCLLALPSFLQFCTGLGT